MQKNKVAILCTTPFQIMSAIAIQIKENNDADIYIDPHFENAYEYGHKIEELALFNRVVVLDNEKINQIRSEKNKIKRIIKLSILYTGNYAEYLFSDNRYEKIYTSTNSLLYSIASYYFYKKRHKFETVCFDDGEGSYDDFKKEYKKIKKKNTILKKMYVYSPSLFKRNYPEIDISLEQIPRWNLEPKIQQAIEYVLFSNKKIAISEKIIILDTMKNECLSVEDAERLEQLYCNIVNESNYDNVIIKRHPRNKEHNKAIKHYPYKSMPFEFIALESDLNDKVLISLTSSAVIMPKIVLDQEPMVVLLYKLFNVTLGENEKRDLMYEACRNEYRDPTKFCIPTSWDKLYDILKNIVAS